MNINTRVCKRCYLILNGRLITQWSSAEGPCPYEQATFLPLYGRNYNHQIFWLVHLEQTTTQKEQLHETAHQLIEHRAQGFVGSKKSAAGQGHQMPMTNKKTERTTPHSSTPGVPPPGGWLRLLILANIFLFFKV